MRKLLISAALASATLLTAAPAVAQPWRLSQSVHREIREDIQQLDRRIQRAEQRRTISRREATSLRRDASNIRRTYGLYTRNGLDRREVQDLQRRVNIVHARLRYEQRDWDRRRG